MAFDSGGAAGGAASGAAVGTSFAPGWGTAIGAVGGGLLGGFMGGGGKSPHFSDVDLQRENPGLWAELQSLSAMANQAEAMYQAKVRNDAAIQAREVGKGVAQLNDRLANQGLLGTSAGLSSSVDAEMALRERIARQAYEEQQAARQEAAQLRNNYVNQYSQAQQGVMGTLNQEYAQNQANNQARNQFIMSGIGALGSTYAQKRNQELGALEAQKNRDFYSQLYAPKPQAQLSYGSIGYAPGYVPGVSDYPSWNGG